MYNIFTLNVDFDVLTLSSIYHLTTLDLSNFNELALPHAQHGQSQ